MHLMRGKSASFMWNAQLMLTGQVFVQVMTYGLGNNNMEWVKEQQSLGFRGIITDDVPSAVQTLKSPSSRILAGVGVA